MYFKCNNIRINIFRSFFFAYSPIYFIEFNGCDLSITININYSIELDKKTQYEIFLAMNSDKYNEPLRKHSILQNQIQYRMINAELKENTSARFVVFSLKITLENAFCHFSNPWVFVLIRFTIRSLIYQNKSKIHVWLDLTWNFVDVVQQTNQLDQA